MKKWITIPLLVVATLSISACSLIPDLPGPIGIPGI